VVVVTVVIVVVLMFVVMIEHCFRRFACPNDNVLPEVECTAGRV